MRGMEKEGALMQLEESLEKRDSSEHKPPLEHQNSGVPVSLV